MSDLPDWCCASGCKKCPAFNAARDYGRSWCSKCERIQEHDEGGCVECWCKSREALTKKRNVSRFDLLVWMRNKRAINKAAGRCINSPITGRGKPHKPVKPGYVRCPKCIETHGRSR